MKKELLSLIIPAYNAEPYLENCLKSILKQTYENLEIIIVDDGSTDRTGFIADQYQDEFSEIISVIHTDNHGVTEARFEGIKASKGEWIGFVDADDEIEQDMYAKLHKNAIQYNADISHCGYVTIVNGGERIHEFYNTGLFLVQNRFEGLVELLDGIFEPTLCTKLFRRKLLMKLQNDNVIDKSIKFYEDLLMNFYLFNSAECSVYEDFCGYHYLARSSSATRNHFQIEQLLDPVYVHSKIYDNVELDLKDIACRNYLRSCIRAYAGLLHRKEYIEKSAEFKSIIVEHKEWWHLLSRNDQIKLHILLISPKLYGFLNKIYRTHFQTKVYE